MGCFPLTQSLRSNRVRPRGSDLFRLTYATSLVGDDAERVLADIMSAAMKNNPVLDITGTIVYDSVSKILLQVMEGPEDYVCALYDTINADDRCTACKLVRQERSLDMRRYPDYGMALSRSVRGSVSSMLRLAEIPQPGAADCGTPRRENVLFDEHRVRLHCTSQLLATSAEDGRRTRAPTFIMGASVSAQSPTHHHRAQHVRKPYLPTCVFNETPASIRPSRAPPLWATPSLVALSIAAYEPQWFLADLLANAVQYAGPSTRVILHYNCHPADSAPLMALPSRVELNPRCVTVRKFCGSVLRAHVLNLQYIEAHTANDALPQFFVTQASNTRWIRPGWEARVALRGSSIDAETRVKDAPPTPSDGTATLLTHLVAQLSNGSGCYGYIDHEGAYLPYAQARLHPPSFKPHCASLRPRAPAGARLPRGAPDRGGRGGRQAARARRRGGGRFARRARRRARRVT